MFTIIQKHKVIAAVVVTIIVTVAAYYAWNKWAIAKGQAKVDDDKPHTITLVPV